MRVEENMSISTDNFKDALCNWASGVTIVTSRLDDRHYGMTVSSFCSVSIQPPQVLFCANRKSHTASVIHEAKSFTVSMLASEQVSLSELFASDYREDVRFDGLNCSLGVTNCPRIPGALVHLDCSLVQEFESGTHLIYVGLVEATEIHDREPLVFQLRTYKYLSDKRLDQNCVD